MKQNIIETIVGILIIGVALFFSAYAYRYSNSDEKESYLVKARFESVEGISKGSDVMLAGIKIGTVKTLTLDSDYFAFLEMKVDKNVQLAIDSQAAIVSSGFLGGKFVSIIPGGEMDDIRDGGRIKFTQSSINMEALIGKFMYSYGGKD